MTPSSLQNKDGRKYPLRMPPTWAPPFPASESEFDQAVDNIAMAVLGIQYDAEDRLTALDLVVGPSHLARNEGNADHVDLSICEKDSIGRCQMVVTGYWLMSAHLEALDYHLKYMIFNPGRGLRFRGSCRFSNINDCVTKRIIEKRIF